MQQERDISQIKEAASRLTKVDEQAIGRRGVCIQLFLGKQSVFMRLEVSGKRVMSDRKI